MGGTEALHSANSIIKAEISRLSAEEKAQPSPAEVQHLQSASSQQFAKEPYFCYSGNQIECFIKKISSFKVDRDHPDYFGGTTPATETRLALASKQELPVASEETNAKPAKGKELTFNRIEVPKTAKNATSIVVNGSLLLALNLMLGTLVPQAKPVIAAVANLAKNGVYNVR